MHPSTHRFTSALVAVFLLSPVAAASQDTATSSSKEAFSSKEGYAQFTFQADDSGAVVGMVLHQNGRDAPARKVR